MGDLRTALHPGTILVSPSGSVRILRSRTSSDDGWNCSDGAAVSDTAVADTEMWTAYSPEELAARLALASEVCNLGGLKELSGGLATWDACSGRPCALPRLARLIR
ncbi:MAG TPA: hypothetical protein VMY16_09775 [Ilumatobacteraceae bacterium]|nr:hypothetical protein [Ilumatobacteraceae bacterium]